LSDLEPASKQDKEVEMQYMITKEECQKKCDGRVCTTCGTPIIPFETVDNSNNPTHWPGCEKCQKFNYGTTPVIYLKAESMKKNYYNVSIDDLCSIVNVLYSDAQAEIEAFRKSEKELSDAHLRIRERVEAWDTKPGGEDRFEVTEKCIDSMKADLTAARETVADQQIELVQLRKDYESVSSLLIDAREEIKAITAAGKMFAEEIDSAGADLTVAQEMIANYKIILSTHRLRERRQDEEIGKLTAENKRLREARRK
jgi:chromosome segregation ATPase